MKFFLRFIGLTIVKYNCIQTKKSFPNEIFKKFWISSGPNLDFLEFPFLRAFLKPISACCTCRVDMIESALERVCPKVYDQGNNWIAGTTGSFSLDRILDGFEKKVQKYTFSIFDILLPWGHFGSRSSPLDVCYWYGWWCVGKVIYGAFQAW